MKLTDAQRDTLLSCMDWAAPYEICYHRNDATGNIIDLGGQRQILGRLRNLGFVEYGACNNTWRTTPAGHQALATSGGRT